MPGLSLQRNEKPGARESISPSDRRDSSYIGGDHFFLPDNHTLHPRPPLIFSGRPPNFSKTTPQFSWGRPPIFRETTLPSRATFFSGGPHRRSPQGIFGQLQFFPAESPAPLFLDPFIRSLNPDVSRIAPVSFPAICHLLKAKDLAAKEKRETGAGSRGGSLYYFGKEKIVDT